MKPATEKAIACFAPLAVFVFLITAIPVNASAATAYWTEDWDNDGQPDHAFQDINIDGLPERCRVDKDEDGNIDEYWIGYQTTYVYDTIHVLKTSTHESYRDDTDGDGAFDQTWIDITGDNRIQLGEIFTISPPEPVHGPEPRTPSGQRSDCTGQNGCWIGDPILPIEPEVWAEDWNSNGIKDHWFSDEDADGNPDWALTDPDENMIFDRGYVDFDDDGFWDEEWESGNVSYWSGSVKDTDQNGSHESSWVDVNGDTRIQSAEMTPLNPPQPATSDPRPMTPFFEICPEGLCPVFPPFLIDPLDHADHDRGSLRLTVTDQGNLGFLDETRSEGSGLVYPDETSTLNHLYVSGLWVSAGSTYVANRDYDADPKIEWVVEADPDGHIEPNFAGNSDQDLEGGCNDDDADDPFGFYIRQESWAFDSESPEDDFVIVRYFIHNRSDSVRNDLRVGLFLDLDIEETPLDDEGATDEARNMAYLKDGATDLHIGVRGLENGTSVPIENLALIPNRDFVWPSQYIPDPDKIGFMSGADPLHSLPLTPFPDDYSLLVSLGPFSLAPAETTEVTFAIVGGLNLPALQAHSDQAQATYNPATTVSLPTTGSAPASLRFLPNAPNPFRRQTEVRFELTRSMEVNVRVYDVTGRQVRTLVSGARTAGPHAQMWDGRDDSGRNVGAGTYFLRIAGENNHESRRITLVR